MSIIYKRLQIADLCKSGMMYRKALEQLPHRLFIKGVDHAYVFCNEAYARDHNITPDEIAGKSDYDFFYKKLAEKIAAEEDEILLSGVTRETMEPYVISGQNLTVLATRAPVRNDNGEIIGLQVVLRDITEDQGRTDSVALLFKDLEDLLVQREAESKVLKIDLEKMTIQRNQLEVEIKDLQENMKKQTAIRRAVIGKVKNNLKRETAKRKDAVKQPQTTQNLTNKGAMAKSSEIILMDVLEFIQKEGGHPQTWCVGVTNDPRRRLFDEHQVHYQNDAWIYRTAASESEALHIQAFFLEFGLNEVKGYRRSGHRMVYAYRKSISTNPSR
jgi:PAS domain S-box-containing protein